MKMLVQVAPHTWVDPEQVVGIEDGSYFNERHLRVKRSIVTLANGAKITAHGLPNGVAQIITQAQEGC
jgi:hypothetical protein